VEVDLPEVSEEEIFEIPEDSGGSSEEGEDFSTTGEPPEIGEEIVELSPEVSEGVFSAGLVIVGVIALMVAIIVALVVVHIARFFSFGRLEFKAGGLRQMRHELK
jgi:hypothetical protein